MATTTDFWSIRDNCITKLEAATPAFLSNYPFRRAPRHVDFADWVASVGFSSACLRTFQINRADIDPEEPLSHQDPSAFEREETAHLVLAYPLLPALYGSGDLNSLDSLIRSDLTVIRRALFTNIYLPGQSRGWLEPRDPVRTDEVWYQPIDILLTYTESQTLSF
jgi:hypothetical protein